MKKIVVLIAVLFFGSICALAESNLNVGDAYFSVMLGGGNAINKIDGLEWGNRGGLSYGLQVMSMISSHVALGVEVSGTNFSSTSNTFYEGSTELDAQVNASIWNVMAAGKIYLTNNPSRIYIPVGIGVGHARVELDYLYNGKPFLHDKDKSNGFSWYAGLGFEAEVSEYITVGFEARIHRTTVEMDFADEKYFPRYITCLAKVGYKF